VALDIPVRSNVGSVFRVENRSNDIALLQADGSVKVVRKFSHESMQRFNDVIADPEGRVFAGTYGEHPGCGLYRVDLDGTITHMFSGTGCSNGMGFSPDLKTFYWTCSTTRQILSFDYDRTSGALANRKLFYQTTSEEGFPDGLAVDSKGNIWSARWRGSCVVRHAADATVLNILRFPRLNVTSICFGGENLDEIFVTSAKETADAATTLGALFKTSVQFQGSKEFRSRISMPSDPP
jgi:sugar lactone lactonase YvrE